VVSGGGGAPLYRVKAPLASTRKVESTYHFIVADVTADAVKLVARRADGSVMDTCGFGHAPGWDCDAKVDATATAAPPRPAAADAPAAAQASRCGCGATGVTRSTAPFAGMLALGLLALRRRARRREVRPC
jgi:MYXO-CTERM domain-containing protein